MSLSKKQKRHLKGLAHSLKPVVMVGQHGLTDGLFNELDIALATHELIKVRVSAGDREERKAMQETLCQKSGADLIDSIGHIAILYRCNPEAPKVTLPNPNDS